MSHSGQSGTPKRNTCVDGTTALINYGSSYGRRIREAHEGLLRQANSLSARP